MSRPVCGGQPWDIQGPLMKQKPGLPCLWGHNDISTTCILLPEHVPILSRIFAATQQIAEELQAHKLT